MPIPTNSDNIFGTTATTLLLLILTVVSHLQSVGGAIIITYKEEQCLEKTGKLFNGAEQDLLIARHDFSSAMEMEMTSKQKMSAKYPEEKLKKYDTACTKYGGKLHSIKIDFFDCTLRGSNEDIELTLKNFANCMADVDECVGFGQEHLLQEAWEELGLHCSLEDEETKKDPPKNNDDGIDDDLAKREKEAAAGGTEEVEKEEKKAEYVPKEKAGKKQYKKRGGGFMKFILFASVCGAIYFVYDRRRQGLPIQLPTWVSSLPFVGGISMSASRFQRRDPVQVGGLASNYNLLSGEDETINYNVNNELQLSSNMTT